MPRDPEEVRKAISDMSPEPNAYGDWLFLGDDDDTHFNLAHVVYVREARPRPSRAVQFQ